jgi:hypothetical protein
MIHPKIAVFMKWKKGLPSLQQGIYAVCYKGYKNKLTYGFAEYFSNAQPSIIYNPKIKWNILGYDRRYIDDPDPKIIAWSKIKLSRKLIRKIPANNP